MGAMLAAYGDNGLGVKLIAAINRADKKIQVRKFRSPSTLEVRQGEATGFLPSAS